VRPIDVRLEPFVMNNFPLGEKREKPQESEKTDIRIEYSQQAQKP
jgi:hypothetical protein